MKNIITALIFFITTNLFSDTTFVYRSVTNNAFTFGERLSFEVSYGFLTAAEAFMNVSPAPYMINGRECYEVSLETNSRSSFDVVYKVRDSYKSFIDKQGIFPWRFEQHIRENDYKRDFEANFVQDSMKVYTKVNFADDKSFTASEFYFQDLISAFYYARTLDWKTKKEGDVVSFYYFYKDAFQNLDIRFEGREEVDVEAGEFRTLVIKPILKEGFTSRTSDILIWLTDDERKVPVKVKLKIIIGAIEAELTSYSGIYGTIDAKIK